MSNEIKTQHMKELSKYRKELWNFSKLKFLYLELTMRCNERCIHCGSRCGDIQSEELTSEQYKDFLDKIKRDFD